MVTVFIDMLKEVCEGIISCGCLFSLHATIKLEHLTPTIKKVKNVFGNSFIWKILNQFYYIYIYIYKFDILVLELSKNINLKMYLENHLKKKNCFEI